MNKRVKSIVLATFAVCLVVGLIAILGKAHQNSRAKYESIWLIHIDSAPYLLLNTSDTRKSGRSFDDYEQIKLLELSTGKLIAEYELETQAYTNFQVLFATNKHLWLALETGYQCLSMPELSITLDPDQFKEKILSFKPGIKNIHSISWSPIDSSFLVENNVAQEFDIHPIELMQDKSTDSITFLNAYNRMGSNAHYEVFKPVYQSVSITIEDIGGETQEDKPHYDYGMTLEDKLKLEKGFEKNYAVILPDTSCLVLDENKRRLLKILVDDSDSLSWNYLADGDVWLRGEFLRPSRSKGSLPKNRSVIHTDKELFIFAHTSLETESDSIYLTAYNYLEDTPSWKINLSSFDIGSSFYPIENMIFEDALISLWLDENNDFVLLSLDVATGVEKWRYLGE